MVVSLHTQSSHLCFSRPFCQPFATVIRRKIEKRKRGEKTSLWRINGDELYRSTVLYNIGRSHACLAAARLTELRDSSTSNDIEQFPGECILTYMEFQLDSAEYCQAQHK